MPRTHSQVCFKNVTEDQPEPRMFNRTPSDFLQLPADECPQLIVTIDTEAEFEWGAPYSRSNVCVDSVSEQHRAQDIFDKYDIIPTYLVDFAVASDEQAVRILRGLQGAGRCEIGSHLNSWLNPPFDEPVSAFHSYPCNLPAGLERRKLAQLTLRIEQKFGARPEVYRAGRYGIGPGTAQILDDLGYRVDLSVMPFTSFASDGGPDFRSFDPRPYTFGATKRLVEIPVTCGFSGWLAGKGSSIFSVLASPIGMSLHFPGIFARLRALERIRLTPEGTSLAEMRCLTQSLLDRGCRVFSLTYHSPSLAPGNTPYVRDQRELRDFLRTIDRYCHYFANELGGKAATPIEISRRICTTG